MAQYLDGRAAEERSLQPDIRFRYLYPDRLYTRVTLGVQRLLLRSATASIRSYGSPSTTSRTRR